MHFPNNSIVFPSEQKSTIEEFLAERCFGFEAHFDESAVKIFPEVYPDAVLPDPTFLSKCMNTDSPVCLKITSIWFKMTADR